LNSVVASGVKRVRLQLGSTNTVAIAAALAMLSRSALSRFRISIFSWFSALTV
jgi:hypothetical protein